MKILITGYKGFIGSHLFTKLSSLGNDVYGIDLKDENDILDCELEEFDLVYHLAAQTSVNESIANPILDAKNNILATIRILEKYRNTRVIYSSSAAIKEILSPYGLSKKTGEEYVKLLSKNYVICRFPNIYGEGGKGVVDLFKNGDIVINGDGLKTRDFVYVGDIVEGLVKAIDWETGIYEFGSGKSVNILDVAKMTGKEILFDDAINGEILKSVCINTTPNWNPSVKIEDYLK